MKLIKDGVAVEVNNERQADRFRSLGYLGEGESEQNSNNSELLKENEELKKENAKLKRQMEKMKENRE